MVILTHIGKIPDYFKFMIQQLRLFNPEEEIIFIGDKKDESLFKKHNIKYDSQNIEDNHKYKKLLALDKKRDIFNTFPTKNFWIFTYARFYLIEEFLKRNNNKSFFFFENDIMIYESLNKIQSYIDQLKGNIFFTVGDDIRITTGFSYFKKSADFIKLVKDMDKIIFDEDEIKDIRKNYSECCPSEMTILRKIKNKYEYIKALPIIPTTTTTFIFDPATYGQVLGGNRQGRKYIDERTYIGQEILKNKISVKFKKDKKGHKKPICIYENKEYYISNLHIHSKNLKNFLS
tara:strand:- start:97 stop:963 length:867 start_codon:yes stop_codon:yes gene_type:complete